MAAPHRYNPDVVRGFYYDHQIMNPLYTVTLHPNTRPFSGGKAVTWKEGSVDSTGDGGDLIIKSMVGPDHPQKHFDTKWDDFFTGGYSEDRSGSNGGMLPEIHSGKHSKYYAEPICSSIFTEDFSFNIANEWSSWDGGNAIEGVFKNLKPYAPMVGSLAKGLKGINPEDSAGGWFSNMLTENARKLGEWIDNSQIESSLNKALYIQGTRYSMYNGTSTQFGNMSMKFTLLSDWKPLYPGSNEYHFLTVYDQFAYIYPYCTGFFEKGPGAFQKFIDTTLSKEMKEAVQPFVDEYIGWQSPPGGFESINRNIDSQQKGTLRLMLGGFYTIDNLVIKNISLNVSRQLCKCPVDSYQDGMIPLYADVSIELQPASVYTDISLGRFLNNSGMEPILAALREATNKPLDKESKDNAKKNEETSIA